VPWQRRRGKAQYFSLADSISGESRDIEKLANQIPTGKMAMTRGLKQDNGEEAPSADQPQTAGPAALPQNASAFASLKSDSDVCRK
jgi:hypothetical protein